MKRRVVITGIGPATATGVGKEEFFTSLLEMKTQILPIPAGYERNYTFKSRYHVPRPEFSLGERGIPKTAENMMEEATKLAVLCASLALDDGGFAIKKSNKYFQVAGLDDCGVIIGVGMSSLHTALESYVAHTAQYIEEKDGNKEDREERGSGQEPKRKKRYNRMVIPMLMPNAASAWISILYGLKGINYTVNAACASGTCAIGEAYRSILDGRCTAALTGGVEALGEKSGAVMRGFDMLTVLTRAQDGIPQPFSQARSGFLFNDGAGCVLILEELQRAKKRGAHIYAELVDYECSCDAYNILQIEPSGANIQELFKKITAGKKIAYLNAHGTGTQNNDDVEAGVIQEVFGDKNAQPYINSTKGLLGHSIGASGAIEAAVTALSIDKAKIHGNLTKDPLDDLNLPLESLETVIDYALSASYGFGGHNAILCFKRYVENG